MAYGVEQVRDELVAITAQLQNIEAAISTGSNPFWTTWSPAIQQGVFVAVSAVAFAEHRVVNGLAQVRCRFTIGGAGTSGQPVLITNWPIAARTAIQEPVIGTGLFYNGANWLQITARSQFDNNISFFIHNQPDRAGVNPPFAVASGMIVDILALFAAI